MNAVNRLIVVALWVTLAMSCNGESNPGTLLDRGLLDAASEAINRRLAITVIPVAEDGSLGSPVRIGNVLDANSAEYDGLTVDQVFDAICPDDCGDIGGDLDAPTCFQRMCQTRSYLCSANSALRVVQSPTSWRVAAPVAWAPAEIVIPPQDAESRYALSQLAFDYARLAVQSAGSVFEVEGPCTGALTQPSGLGDAETFTNVEYFASAYVEAMHLEDESNDEMRRAELTIADSYFAEQPSRALGIAERYTHERVGLFAYARTIAGGRPDVADDEGSNRGDGFGGDTASGTTAYCPSAPLAGAALDAMRFLRLAAPPPAIILLYDGAFDGHVAPSGTDAGTDTPAAVSIEELLVGPWPSLYDPGFAIADPDVCDGDSVGCRLSFMLHEPALRDLHTATELAERLGVTVDDFIAARARLADEFFAYYRSFDRAVEGVPVGIGELSSEHFVRYSATGLPPTPPPASFYAAMASYDPQPDAMTLVASEPAFSEPGYQGYTHELGWGNGSQINAEDGALTRLGRILSSYDFSVDDATAQAGALLATEAGTRGPNRRGRLAGCWGAASSSSFENSFLYMRVDVPSGVEGTDLRVVAGLAGLECATLGTIDGAPCSSGDFASLVLADTAGGAQTWTATTPQSGFEAAWVTAVDAAALHPGDNSPGAAGPAKHAVTAFVVRHREGAIGGPAGYTELAGVELRVANDEGGPYIAQVDGHFPEVQHCTQIAIEPERFAAIRTAVAPDPHDCGDSLESCAGLPSDFRIPLENELTTDGDQVESSWRHYLASAAAAADEADALGEQLIAHGLEMSMRQEQAVEELTRICGTPINVEGFPARLRGPCEDGVCPTGYRCVGRESSVDGQCVIDPVEYAVNSADAADRQRLRACLGGDDVGYAVLGNDPTVCVWDFGDPASVCQGATAEHPCPFPLVAATCAASTVAPDGAHTRLIDGNPGADDMSMPSPSEAILSLFEMPDETEGAGAGTTTGTGSLPPCAQLAAWRAAGGAAEFLDDNAMMSALRIRELAANLGWEASPGDFSQLTLNGSRIAATGSAIGDAGAGTGGPCQLGADGFATDARCGGLFGPPTMSTPHGRCLDGMDASAPNDDPNRSLFCHWGGADREGRARMNDMLARAVMAARLLGGQTFGGGSLRVPYYGRYGNPLIELASPHWTPYATYAQTGGQGELRSTTDGQIITGGGGDYGSYGASFISDLRGTAYSIVPQYRHTTGGMTSWWDGGVEWTLCPYDASDASGCVEIFDDTLDPDDVGDAAYTTHAGMRAGIGDDWDRDAPLVIRPLDRRMEGTEPLAFIDAIWGPANTARADLTGVEAMAGAVRRAFDEFHDGPADLAFAASLGVSESGPLSTGTRYWRRQALCSVEGAVRCTDADLADEMVACDSNHARADRLTSGCRYLGTWRAYVEDLPLLDQGAAFYYAAHHAQAEGLTYYDSFDANRAFIAQRGLTNEDVINGLELLCYAAEDSAGIVSTCDGALEQVETFSDATRVAAYLDCQAATVRRRASTSLFVNIPRRVVDVLRSSNGAAYGSDAGDFGAEVDNVRAALVTLGTAEGGMASALRGMGNALATLHDRVQSEGFQEQIGQLQLDSTIFDRVAGCAQGVASAAGSTPPSAGGCIAAGIGCVNAGAQIALAAQIRAIDNQQLHLALDESFHQFDDAFNAANTSLSEQSANLFSSLESMSAALGRLHTQQQEARRALARALLLSSDVTGEVWGAARGSSQVDAVMHARFDTDLARYREAHDRAVRLAAIARIALEQRLGMPLRSLETDLVTVDAPSHWADDICRMPSIDYDAIAGGGDGSVVGPDDYSGTYVGDYVRRLEQVFESYSFAYPFQDGTDRAVVSLRDELLGIRTNCPVAGPNVLFHSDALDAVAADGADGWNREGCEELSGWSTDAGAVDAGAGVVERAEVPGCVRVTPASEGAAGAHTEPVVPASGRGDGVQGRRVFFGGAVAAPPGASCSSGCDGITASSRLVQWVTLEAGEYILSWYGRETPSELADGAAPINPSDALAVLSRRSSEEPLVVSSVAFDSEETASPDWKRYSLSFSATGTRQIGIAIRSGGVGLDLVSVVDVGGIMLERRHDGQTGASPYWATGTILTHDIPSCEDTTGIDLREHGFTYGCETVCPGGYGASCTPPYRESRCYYQASFELGAQALERLVGRGGSGFAGGNFNYRIETISANVVGTGVRDCSRVAGATASTCYASSGIAYSLLHTGPFPLNNARGEIYDAPLFPGRIESARALAAERYITNPVSSADEVLSGQYLRAELRGRPLGGLFTLRIWDDEGVVFDHIEDIQLVLGYRYWTRQQ